MKSKKYSSHTRATAKKELMVKERGSGRYARKKSRRLLPRIGISISELRKRLSRPVRRSERDINWAMGIAGIGEGPEDLSENMRAYLREGR